MPDLKEFVRLFDDDGDDKIDGAQLGDLIRAMGYKPTNATIEKANGGKLFKKGEKRIGEADIQPVLDAVKKEKEVGSYNDFFEALKTADKEENGKITKAELKHTLIALGERLTGDQAEEIIRGHLDGEGRVDYKNFIKAVMAAP